MRRLKIEIGLDGTNELVQNTDREVARILRRLGDRITDDGVGVEGINCTRLMDANGNSVGDVWLEDDNA